MSGTIPRICLDITRKKLSQGSALMTQKKPDGYTEKTDKYFSLLTLSL